ALPDGQRADVVPLELRPRRGVDVSALPREDHLARASLKHVGGDVDEGGLVRQLSAVVERLAEERLGLEVRRALAPDGGRALLRRAVSPRPGEARAGCEAP